MTAPAAAAAIASSGSSSANTTVTTTAKRRRRRSRPVPFPNSILDRSALVAALEMEGLYGTTVQPVHVTCFYQALHRQHYPAQLVDFVTTYHRHEQALLVRSSKTKNTSSSNNNNNNNNHQQCNNTVVVVDYDRDDDDDNNNNRQRQRRRPLKNNISARKNRNKMQLPRAFLDFLITTDKFVALTSTIAAQRTSADGSTTKLVIQLHDGQLVESVLMRYTGTTEGVSSSSSGSRASLCVSSQCGCAMGCTFCATGTMGLTGNLTTGEILEQIVHANRILAEEWQTLKENNNHHHRDSSSSSSSSTNGGMPPLPKLDLVRNVVFMGMGEPLDNYNNVVEACRALIDNRRWNLAHQRVTVSTVGIIDKIRKLTKELPEVNLALSLHAPNQAMRSAIVPTAKHFPIEQLIDALDGHMMAYLKQRKKNQQAAARHKQSGVVTNNRETTSVVVEEEEEEEHYTVEERIKERSRRRAMIEYVMLEGDTSTMEAAHELGKLCEGRQLVVNLIPYNQTDVKDKLRCPSDEHMNEFRNIVASYGTFCTIRRTMGADIDSACGQLITALETTNNNSSGPRSNKENGGGALRDIEDVASNVAGTTASKIIFPKAQKSSSFTARTKEEPKALSVSGTQRGVELERWIRPLAVATSLAASCFVVSTALFLKQQKRR